MTPPKLTVAQMTKYVPIPKGVNVGLSSARQATMIDLLGHPRANYSQECQAITHPVLRTMIVTESVGPFRVTGLKPVVASLRAIMVDVQKELPEIYAQLGSAGMACARFVRGSKTAISNHSWSTAIDLTLAGALDRYGDGLVQAGLIELAKIFNRHKWFWGAVFRKEDGMHFECSEQLIREWANAGVFGQGAKVLLPARPSVLSRGDRGEPVRQLQMLLNKRGAKLRTDGDFGDGTHDAVIAYQKSKGLVADGRVGLVTMAALENAQ